MEGLSFWIYPFRAVGIRRHGRLGGVGTEPAESTGFWEPLTSLGRSRSLQCLMLNLMDRGLIYGRHERTHQEAQEC